MSEGRAVTSAVVSGDRTLTHPIFIFINDSKQSARNTAAATLEKPQKKFCFTASW